jgi:hypothetical protein
VDTESKATEHGDAPGAGTAAPGESPPAPTFCSVDADCSSQQICVAERCTEP